MSNIQKLRADDYGAHRQTFERNRKKIYATQDTCAICGRPVDFNLKYPNPMAPSIDHIIPIDRGGHPSDIDNLQLAHWSCNRQKSNKLMQEGVNKQAPRLTSNRNLPQSKSWVDYKATSE